MLQRPEVKISEGDVKETSVIAGALLLRTACRLYAAAERVNIHDNTGCGRGESYLTFSQPQLENES